ncbi:unnamed protein product [Coffea canephora]|uniref:DH200=94 genomic scaffold, scaffold_1208 n=1 Tax=Coffea canephora TaxID=49390 RepID=A0A068VHX7_COFCA|nr:unnamed protein product [Coffea canephora]
METPSEGSSKDSMTAVKQVRQQLESRVKALHNAQLHLIASLQNLVLDLVSSCNLSLKAISSFNSRPFSPLPNPNNLNLPNYQPSKLSPRIPTLSQVPNSDANKFLIDDAVGPFSLVRSMVAICLLKRVPFTTIDYSIVLRKLENDQFAMPAE